MFDMPNKPETVYRKLPGSEAWVDEVEGPNGQTFLQVSPKALEELSYNVMRDIAHLLRPAHLQQLSNILDDSEASDNDRFVALELLKNANVAAGMVLPGCQDTGTAIVMGKRGMQCMTDGEDEKHISQGIYNTYTQTNLRYSQVAATDMFAEKNTGTNLPAQFDIYATNGNEYHFMYVMKGGGSANKTFLFQQTKSLLNEKSFVAFLEEKIKTIGTAACPPYHLALVVGGMSAEMNLKSVKLASTKYYDGLKTQDDLTDGNIGQAFRDTEWEARILKMCQDMGIGAQFGGKYFCHDVRVIRLPRHGASVPVGLGVSCSADRQALAKITPEGVFIEQLETDPGRFLPDVTDDSAGTSLSEEVVKIDLNRPMDEVRAELTNYETATRLSLTGTIIVARDIAHAKMQALLDAGKPLPDYIKNHVVYYAGPAKTPEGEDEVYATGSFGPTTAGRMDSYVGPFQAAGGSYVMLAKGNRSKQVTKACKEHGGFYLGSIGGPAAILAKNCIKHVEVLDYPEDGMEAVWKIDVEDFPAFIVVDDKGNDFFSQWLG
jgi:fumarate hydratase, class I